MAGNVRVIGGVASVLLFVGALASGCSDTTEPSLGNGAGNPGAAGSAGAPEAGSGDWGLAETTAGAAGEAPEMGGAAGAPSPSDVAGAAGDAGAGAALDCGPHHAGAHCEFKKILALDTFVDLDSTSAVVKMSRDGKYIAAISQKGVPPVSAAYRVSASTGVAINITPPLASNCSPTAISEDGAWIAGQCRNGLVTRAFYWTEAGGAAFYDPALNIESVTGISADATLLFGWRNRSTTADGAAGAGGSDNAPNDVAPVFRWSADGTFLDNSAPPEHWPMGEALANRDGSIVILNAGLIGSGPSVTSVYRWSAQAGLQPMTAAGPYYDDYRAIDIARQLDITIGNSSWSDHSGSGSYAQIWSRTRAASQLVDASSVSACNRDCSVIAGNVTDAHDQVGPGLLTHLSAPKNQEVRAEAHLLIELLGVTTDLNGWSLGDIVAMSDDGKVIAGDGWLDGKRSGWVIHL